MTGHDLGLLALRLGAGAALVGHGTQKLLGWFGGGGVAGTAKFMEAKGFSPGRVNALIAGATETGGGALLALGLGTKPAAAAVIGTMAVAGSTQARNGFFATQGGFELPYTYALVASGLLLTGSGRYGLDHPTGNALNRPWMTVSALVAAVASATFLIARAQRLTATEQDPAEPE